MYEFKILLSQDESLIWASLVNSGEELLDSLLEKERTEDKVLVNDPTLSTTMLTSSVTPTTFALHRPRSWRHCDKTRKLRIIISGPLLTRADFDML